MKKLSIIIPVYNEKSTLLEIIDKIEKTNFPVELELIIVDDFSTDGSRDLIKNLPSKYITLFHEINKGKGAAIKTAQNQVTGDYVIIQDADLEYNPNDIIKLLNFAEENNQKIVYGSRNLTKNPRYKKSYYWGGKLITFITNILFKTKLTDVNTCYKLFDSRIFKSIELEQNRFSFCEEITAKAIKQGESIKEIPISYKPRSSNEGKKIKPSDGLIAIQTLIKYRFSKKQLSNFFTGIALTLIVGSFLAITLPEAGSEFTKLNEDNNAVYSLAVQNWNNEGFLNLKMGMITQIITDENNLSFYTHHPSGFLYPTLIIYKIFGVSEFTTRLSPIIFSVLSIIVLYLLISTKYSKKISLLSTFFFATLPAITFYGRMLDHEIFVLFFALLTFLLFYKLKQSYSKKLLAFFIITIIAGNFVGWHYYFAPAIIWIYILFDKNFPLRKKLLLLLPFLEFGSFGIHLLHFYSLGGIEAITDLKNIGEVRTARLPTTIWLRRLLFTLKFNISPPLLFVSIIGILFSIFKLIKTKKPTLDLALLAFPILIIIVFKQWSIHLYAVMFFAAFAGLSIGKIASIFIDASKHHTKSIIFSTFIFIFLIGSQFIYANNLMKINNSTLAFSKDTIGLFESLNNDSPKETICLSAKIEGEVASAIAEYYTKHPITSIKNCDLENTNSAIIFHPSLHESYQKDVDILLESSFVPQICKGEICLLEKVEIIEEL